VKIQYIKTAQLMLFREIIAVCSGMHTKHINTVRIFQTQRGCPVWKLQLPYNTSYVNNALLKSVCYMMECSIVASTWNRPIIIVRRQAATHTALSDSGPSFKIFCRILQEVDSDILVRHIPGDCNLNIWTTRRNQAGALLTGIHDVTGSIFGRT